MKHWLRRTTESGLLLGFTLAAAARPNKVSGWSSPGDQSILIVAPHPDDEAMGCAGTALLHAAHCDRVRLAIATDGRRSRALADPAEMAECRRQEATKAAAHMQIQRLEWLGLREGEWQPATLEAALLEMLHAHRPAVIYAPSRIDFHPEHLRVAHALAKALDAWQCAPAAIVRVYQIQVPLTATLSNLVADVSATQAAWREALACYTSQAASVHCSLRMRRYGARRRGGVGHAESFWEMPAADYIRLHKDDPASWTPAFRSLRYSPWTDPLAYLKGSKERRRLRTVGAAGGE